jgi:hypothetical protein
MQPKIFLTVSVLAVASLSALVAGIVAYNMSRRIATARISQGTVQMRELNIVDEHGKVFVTLSAAGQTPTVQLLAPSGQKRITMAVDQRGYGSVQLINPDPAGPVVSLAIDDKGAHVKFDRPGGASSYLFLNNSAGSGVVLIDAKGSRKLDLVVTPTGETEFHRYDQASPKTP